MFRQLTPRDNSRRCAADMVSSPAGRLSFWCLEKAALETIMNGPLGDYTKNDDLFAAEEDRRQLGYIPHFGETSSVLPVDEEMQEWFSAGLSGLVPPVASATSFGELSLQGPATPQSMASLARWSAVQQVTHTSPQEACLQQHGNLSDAEPWACQGLRSQAQLRVATRGWPPDRQTSPQSLSSPGSSPSSPRLARLSTLGDAEDAECWARLHEQLQGLETHIQRHATRHEQPDHWNAMQAEDQPSGGVEASGGAALPSRPAKPDIGVRPHGQDGGSLPSRPSTPEGRHPLRLTRPCGRAVPLQPRALIGEALSLRPAGLSGNAPPWETVIPGSRASPSQPAEPVVQSVPPQQSRSPLCHWTNRCSASPATTVSGEGPPVHCNQRAAPSSARRRALSARLPAHTLAPDAAISSSSSQSGWAVVAHGRRAMERIKDPHLVCTLCGNTFMQDSYFCRKCGRRRPTEEAQLGGGGGPAAPRLVAELRPEHRLWTEAQLPSMGPGMQRQGDNLLFIE